MKIKHLDEFKKEAMLAHRQAKTEQELVAWQVKYLGRKGQLAELMQGLKNLSLDERKIFGPILNELKAELSALASSHSADEKIEIDTTLPGLKPEVGHLHPLTKFLDELLAIFTRLGFEVVQGPEVELARYNFDLLNIPENHPARDMWDTYYVKTSRSETVVLRTHTSPVQLRAMETRQPPVRLVAPGRVFRHEATDASHETGFYQCEGLVLDRGISVADMIGTLSVVMKQIYGAKTRLRVRPSFFPFVEPGFEADISCVLCGGAGCSVCKQTGWVEMLGAGMVHPEVLKNMNVNYPEVTGFAFGMGIDRMMMLKYQVNDIRLSYSGDVRFICQF